MRKIKCVLLGLTFSLCMLGLVGCGKDDDNDGSDKPSTSRENSTTGKVDQLGKNIETIFDDTGTMIKDLVE